MGKRSQAILKQLEVLESNQEMDKKDGEIGHVFIMDRDFDYASCLLSPVTYEALLDEVFGINCGVVDIGDSNAKLELSSRDRTFENIRGKHFSEIFSHLSNTAKQLQASQSKASNMNVNEMREFVQEKLKLMQQQSKYAYSVQKSLLMN